MPNIKKLISKNKNFYKELDAFISKRKQDSNSAKENIKEIISKVKTDGDKALIEFSKKFDSYNIENPEEFLISKEEIKDSVGKINKDQRDAISFAIENVKKFSDRQKIEPWSFMMGETYLGQKVEAIEKIGIYVPGGKASYPSTVIMNAIPAKVAGVKEIIMVVPTQSGKVNDLVVAAAHFCEIDKIYKIGGAQAIAALAYGTNVIPKVDKVVGPGNQYVSEAKRELSGIIGVDNFAGPSEVLIIADDSANPSWVAMDLLSQAEHDQMAQSILISSDEKFLESVLIQIDNFLPQMNRKDTINLSLENYGLFISSKGLSDSIEISNHIAPEHLQLCIEKNEDYVPEIKNAGAIFLGNYTPEVFGDYCAGPNHVLPTMGTAKFSSPLGVYEFQKRSNIIKCSRQSAYKLSKYAEVFAKAEGLQAHMLSAALRKNEEDE
ncbi:MAG: histidinol dehydrogenase [Gammaproteobacteria bacterium]|nr:histidinol dehydrogenase [Gammaproteobacteria bacterium]|tara:strand:+ start:16865 stop:18172 length:1308 start_codon:yes stop_codon:yes gene_type:complete